MSGPEDMLIPKYESIVTCLDGLRVLADAARDAANSVSELESRQQRAQTQIYLTEGLTHGSIPILSADILAPMEYVNLNLIYNPEAGDERLEPFTAHLHLQRTGDRDASHMSVERGYVHDLLKQSYRELWSERSDEFPPIFNEASAHDDNVIEFWDAYQEESSTWPLHRKLGYCAFMLQRLFESKGYETCDIDLDAKVAEVNEQLQTELEAAQASSAEASAAHTAADPQELTIAEISQLQGYVPAFAEVDRQISPNAVGYMSSPDPLSLVLDHALESVEALPKMDAGRNKPIGTYSAMMAGCLKQDNPAGVIARMALILSNLNQLLSSDTETAVFLRQRFEFYRKTHSCMPGNGRT